MTNTGRVLSSAVGEVDVPRDPLIERMLGHIEGDRVFNVALEKVRSVGALVEPKLRPAGVDAVACLLARNLARDDCDQLAFALPRGAGPLPVLLGLYLALFHKAQALSRRRFARAGTGGGSVSVASMRPELRQLARRLTFDGSELSELVIPAKLVSRREKQVDGTVRRRAAAVPLRGGERVGLSQRDSFLLFHRPATMPPVAHGVIETMVVDTAGAAASTWEKAYDRNRAAQRNQLWLGDLGDRELERFCAARDIPLVRFDWTLLADAATLRHGTSPLASSGLDARAADRDPIAWHLVSDEEREEEFAKVYEGLREMRKRGRSDMPDVLRVAYRLAGLLSRLACPLELYERAAGPNPYAANAGALMAQCEQVGRAAFVGNRWKHAFDDHWPVVMAALRNLMRYAEDERRSAKDDALVERVMAADEAGETARVLCQTRAEALAVREMLDSYGILQALDVHVSSYAERASWGADSPLVTLLVAPPPPWHAPLLLSGENGRIGVLCYAHEVGRLRGAVRSAETDFAGAAHNRSVGDGLRLPPAPSLPSVPSPVPADRLIERDGYGTRRTPAPNTDTDITDPGGGVSCWEELVGLYGQDLPLGRFGEEPDIDAEAAYGGQARLVRFTDAQPVFFRDDAPVTVYLPDAADDESPVMSLLPEGLTAGMTVVFLPGAQRNDLLGTLMDAWDEQLAMERQMFEPLFREALEKAVETVGIDGLAKACGHIPATVRNWVTGHNWPQKPEKFKVILDLADLPHVTRARAPIWRYFERVRGAHRYIGRLLNEAVEETVVGEADRDTLDKLSRLVGRDLEDIFDQVEAVTVASVEAPRAVPLAACGQFLDSDDPYIKKEGYA